ncbi:hypothetical protein BJ684DRAFT_19600 [Piptocephalis cylindrospora]|uniref:Uncharacterized protein n=1 Tax=Piptocephalis cylindrospora TaxID=1907219 RepID=A0A4V1IYB3_9FUNG|nr:hypothetical protein BJ684DRAFT_19600 [Piptocephalis cylindrospora]|eukprot:RKP13959.1 hypothetical protein BJ684DRAFT_19600 [Piptocephalis cylindrospora]
MRFSPASLENFPCAKPSSQGSLSTPSQRKAARRYLEAMSRKSSSGSLRARSPPAGPVPDLPPPPVSPPCRTRPSSVDLTGEPPIPTGVPLVVHSKSEGSALDRIKDCPGQNPTSLCTSETPVPPVPSIPSTHATTLPVPPTMLDLPRQIDASSPPMIPLEDPPLIQHSSPPTSPFASLPDSPIESEDETSPAAPIMKENEDDFGSVLVRDDQGKVESLPYGKDASFRSFSPIKNSLNYEDDVRVISLEKEDQDIEGESLMGGEIIMEGDLDVEESVIYDEEPQEDFHFIPSDCTDSSVEMEEEDISPALQTSEVVEPREGQVASTEATFQSQSDSEEENEDAMDRLRLKYRYIRVQNQSLLRELEASKATADALRTVVETSEYHLISALERSSELEGRIRNLETSLKRERANNLAHASFRTTRRVLSPTRSSSSGMAGSDGAGSPRRMRSPTRRGARDEMSDLQRRRALLRERSRAREEEQKSWQEKLTRLSQREERVTRHRERFNAVSEEEEGEGEVNEDQGIARGMRRSYPSPHILRTSSPLSSASSPEDGEGGDDDDGDGEQSLVGIAVDMLSEMSALMEEPDYTPNTSLILS